MATERSEVPLGSSPKRPRLDQNCAVPRAESHLNTDICEQSAPKEDSLETNATGPTPGEPPILPKQQDLPLCASETESDEARPNVKPCPSDAGSTTLDPGTSPARSLHSQQDFDVDELDVRTMRVVSSNWPGTSSEMMSPTEDEPPPLPGSEKVHQQDSHKQDDNEIDSDLDLGLGDISPEPISGPLGWLHQKMMTGVDPRTILARILPPDFSLPSDMTDLDMWGLIVEYFQAFEEPEKRKKLEDVNTLDDAVSLLKRCTNVIVLSGAGVSVSCGIPDFRSRDGIYARLAVDFPDLPDPQAMFDIHYFRKDPRPFFKFAKEIYPGQYEPSICHRFISLLEKNGKLLRNYSQNIDTLEQVAGITKVVQCHGSFATATCTICGYKVDADVIREDVFNQVVPKCPRCQPDPGARAILKPDIVFFGEGLPSFFYDCLDEDKTKVDLLIVIGSSLKVRPVATIPCPSVVGDSVPQILINREPLPHMNFDIELLGDGDVIINELCHRLGAGWDQICGSSGRLREVTEIPRPLEGSQSPRQAETGSDTGGHSAKEIDIPRPRQGSQSPEQSSLESDTGGHSKKTAELPKPSKSAEELHRLQTEDRGVVALSGSDVSEMSVPSPSVTGGSGKGDENDPTHDEREHGPVKGTVLKAENVDLRTKTHEQGDQNIEHEKHANTQGHEHSSEIERTESEMGQSELDIGGERGPAKRQKFEMAPTPPELDICASMNGSEDETARTGAGNLVDEVESKPRQESVQRVSKAEPSTSEALKKREAECKEISQDKRSQEEAKGMPRDGHSSGGAHEGGSSNGADSSGIAGQRSSGGSARSTAAAKLENASEAASSAEGEKSKGRNPRPRRQSITEYMEPSTYLFIPPNRYVFHGAEVYRDDSGSDVEQGDKRTDSQSADDIHSALAGGNPDENHMPSQYSQDTSSSECDMLSPDSSTEARVSLQLTNDTSSSQELSTADL